ncbi:MAG: sodium:calcium antiporter [Phycisphaerae bacterium]
MILASLIEVEFFEAQNDVFLWLFTAGAIAMLVFAADKAVASAAKLAALVGLSKVIIGATVVSLGTTSPEAAVSVKAAWGGDASLALANGMGSIICDTGLIFGLCCLMKKIPMDRFILNRHGWLQLGSGLLLAAIMVGGYFYVGGRWAAVSENGVATDYLAGFRIERWVGVLFIALLVGYMYLSIRWARSHPELVPDEAKADIKPTPETKWRNALLHLAIVLVGLGFVVFGSEVLVGSVKVLAHRAAVPKSVIGASLVAFGTSLPELVTALTAIRRGHTEILVGNLLGADILNVLFVIGASAVARPLAIDQASLFLNLPAMILILLLFRSYYYMNRTSFRRWQGVPLLAVYFGYLAILVMTYSVPR